MPSTPDLSLPLYRDVQMVPLALCCGFVCDLAPVLLMLQRASDESAWHMTITAHTHSQ